MVLPGNQLIAHLYCKTHLRAALTTPELRLNTFNSRKTRLINHLHTSVILKPSLNHTLRTVAR